MSFFILLSQLLYKWYFLKIYIDIFFLVKNEEGGYALVIKTLETLVAKTEIKTLISLPPLIIEPKSIY